MQDREAPDPARDGDRDRERDREREREQERDEERIFAAALDGPRAPRATYRVQLQPGFGFAAAGELVAYLDDLGVSDLYTSPFFKAVSGSLHGYDLVDPNRLNPELGEAASFDELTRRLRARGMGLLLDFVPNHMGVARGENAYWTDVLENGPSSIHAAVFDIDWAPLKSELARKVLLPLLDAPFGTALERGDLRPAFEDGAFVVGLHGAKLPLDPSSFSLILGPSLPGLVARLGEAHPAVLELRSVLTGLAHLPAGDDTRREKVSERRREKEMLKRRLAALVAGSPEVEAAVRARIAALAGTPGDPRSFDELEALLDRQAYRLGFFRVAAEEINYRRFFDVNELAAIRVENPAVFVEVHRLLFELIAAGQVTGLRVDHPDGLWEPARYFSRVQRGVFLDRARLAGADPALLERLAERYDRASAERPLRPLYIVAEKILARGEELPAAWAVHGTSGYDFAALLGGLFVDGANEGEITRIYERFVGPGPDRATLTHDGKRLILETALAGELNVLAHALNRLSESDRHTRDFTLGTLTAALREVCACFPVYRTYVGEEPAAIAPGDRAAIGVAIRLARRRDPTTDASVYDFLRSVLLRELPEAIAEADRRRLFPFVMKVQQLTPAVMAKGVEDTAFYRYLRLSALCEVGGDPSVFGTSLEHFHQVCAATQARWPLTMTTLTTHDTKRSEDVRARLVLLSQLPAAWGEAVTRWAALAARHGKLDAATEQLVWQSLVGAWPITPDRAAAYLEKATREAKAHTCWVDPVPAYDGAVAGFVRGVLADEALTGELAAFVTQLEPAWQATALAQKLVQLTMPGVADVYQGTELWDLSLVDPDNRRPVDYAARAAELDAPTHPKLRLVRAALRLRREHPSWFGADATYNGLDAGPGAVAFCRAGRLVTVAPIRSTSAWSDADAVTLPPGNWADAVTGAERSGRVRLADLFEAFPVALLIAGVAGAQSGRVET